MNNIFRIRKQERWLVLAIAVCVIGVNAMLISYYFHPYTHLSTRGYRFLMSTFRVSGFDSFTYYVVTEWHQRFIIFRHPLLAYMLWPSYLLNSCIMRLFGFNAAIFIVSAMEAFCGFYSTLFLHRIFTDVISLKRLHATLLTLFYVSFGYVLLSFTVPDHFGFSVFLLVLSLYVSGMKMKAGHLWTKTESFIYFILTAGITLSNGVKVYLSELFVNGRRFFQWKHLLLAVLLPAALVWGSTYLTYDYFVKPIIAAERIHGEKVAKILKKKHIRKEKKHATTGKPLSKMQFLNWTDISTARDSSLVENFFGEPLQLHEDYLLADNGHTRPVIVQYRYWISYFVEFIIVALFLAGIWFGRRSRFLWLVMSYFTVDVFLHILLGFAINEVYIMSPHYLFALPIAIAYLLRGLHGRALRCTTALLSVLALYLFIWNVNLLVEYFFIL